MSQKYEFRSRMVETDDHSDSTDKIARVCNEWANEGFEVFSVECPQPSNWHHYRLTAKRQISTKSNLVGRKFR